MILMKMSSAFQFVLATGVDLSHVSSIVSASPYDTGTIVKSILTDFGLIEN
jgi:hypothetical protein